MTPPASPRKRRRPASSASPTSSPKNALAPPPTLEWWPRAKQLSDTVNSLFVDFIELPQHNSPPEVVMYGLSKLRITFTNITTHLDQLCSNIAHEHPMLADRCPTFEQQTQTDNTPPSPPVELEPSCPSQPARVDASTQATSNEETFAQVVSRRKPRQSRPKPLAPAPTALMPPIAPSNPTRVIAHLQNQPDLNLRALTKRELYQQFTTACAAVPKAPSLLAAYWTKKGNLVLAFPSQTSHTSIKAAFPAIRSMVGSDNEFMLRFDVPWRKIHLAGIRVRDDPNSPIASEEDLRQSLLLNPAVQALKITVQASWLKKPDAILGTHTSAVIAFEDPDGLIERNLLKSALFAFGESITVKKWFDKPPANRRERPSPITA